MNIRTIWECLKIIFIGFFSWIYHGFFKIIGYIQKVFEGG